MHLPHRRAARRAGPVAGLVLPLALALLAPARVAAHAELATADPADGAVVAPAQLTAITLTFAEDLAAGSKLELVGPGVDTSVDWQAGGPPSMTLPLSAALADGAYEVRWTSVSTDDDILRGIVHFTVSTTESPSPTAGPSPAAASGVPSPAPSASGGDASSGGSDALLPVAALAVVLVAGGAWFLARGRRAAA